MDELKAARILDPETGTSHMKEFKYKNGFGWRRKYETVLREALSMGADALRRSVGISTSPLTLEQLRGMEGMPVLYKRTKTWFTVNLHHPEFGECVIHPAGFYIPLKVAAERGVFAYLPAHIDREAWTAEWKDHYRSGANAGTGYVCSSCDMWNGRKSHICPSCGKAMDEDGLAELEKRLRG